jgi:hypothetical protein
VQGVGTGGDSEEGKRFICHFSFVIFHLDIDLTIDQLLQQTISHVETINK